MLIDMVSFVCRREDFGLVDVVDAELLQHLRFGEMPNTTLSHYGNVDGLHDLANYGDLGHASHAAFGADLCGNAFQRHHRCSAGALRDLRLSGGSDVHDDAALEHFCKTCL